VAKVGIADVATRAGVSVTTVSHVLSGRRPVADATRSRVLEVIRELGYQPDAAARSLRTGRTMTVALIVPDLTNPFYPVVARGLEDRLRPAGYHAVVCNTDGRRDEELSFLREMVSRGVDGIVAAAFGLTREDLLAHKHLPLVRVGGRFDASTGDLVRSDDEAGTTAAVRHLLACGHRRLGFAGGAPDVGPSRLREAGFRNALAEAGVAVDEALVVSGDFTREAGRAAARRLLDAYEAPTAVVCANDLIAIGVLDEARARGLAVPGDLAVTGYDDIDAASLVTPALTTVVNPAREIGRVCGELLLARLAGGGGPKREIVLANSLVVRDSAPIPHTHDCRPEGGG
jgi:LacI family transcriptional regulator